MAFVNFVVIVKCKAQKKKNRNMFFHLTLPNGKIEKATPFNS